MAECVAKAIDMEPGMWFCCRIDRTPLVFVGVERVVSRFPGRERVRVLARGSEGAVSWVADRHDRYPLVSWERA